MFKKRIFNIHPLLWAVAIILSTLIAGPAFCRKRPQIINIEEQFNLLGTLVEIQIPCSKDQEQEARQAIMSARDEIARLEQLMSLYLEESDISRVNRNASEGPVPVSEETFQTVKKAVEFSVLSQGAFDVSFMPVGKLWRLNPENPYIPTEEEIREKMPLVNYKNIVLDDQKKTIFFKEKGMEIGLGGIAKGTAVNWAIRAIRKRGFPNALVNAGGDLYALGLNAKRKPWRIGIQHPRDASKFFTTIEVSNRAVVTSGDYERMVIVNGKRFHHILDTKTGHPAEKCISVTVVTEDAESADALATAIFVLGAEKGLELVKKMPDTEALIVTSDEKIYATDTFGFSKGQKLP